MFTTSKGKTIRIGRWERLFRTTRKREAQRLADLNNRGGANPWVAVEIQTPKPAAQTPRCSPESTSCSKQ